MGTKSLERRLPIGAELLKNDGVHFRVWAPKCRSIEVVLEEAAGAKSNVTAFPLIQEANGYHAATVPEAVPGTLYRYRLDGARETYPDPASRFQPQGPHGPSQVVDPGKFAWSDQSWNGARLEGQIIYEMHVGTFTPAGTWTAACEKLPLLADLGITVLELMPVSEFPGRFGWGYDGVDIFAPTRLYGTPEDFRNFVNRAHAVGLGVILDVVYNHFGPDGNYLKHFADSYFTDRYKNEWGEAINFDGQDAAPVREFFLANARYWIDEFHIDGLRLDATQQIFDSSSEHILAAITRAVHAASSPRAAFIVAENEVQQVKLVRPLEQGGHGIDGLWNDDFHHSALVALTGHNQAYYSDYLGSPQEFISAAKYGYLYQGQYYSWQKKGRGTPTFGVPPAAFVNFIENHDQIANSGRGLRCHFLTSPACHRAMTAVMILLPGTPMLFQGQEFNSSRPFLYFADHNPELARLVAKGRKEFLAQFPNVAVPQIQDLLPDPSSVPTFESCKLDWSEQQRHKEIFNLHRDLLRLRRRDPVFCHPRPNVVDGSVLAPEVFVLRYFGGKHGDRLLIVNLGRDINLSPEPEPLLAPPEDHHWQILWSSEDARYGGNGIISLDSVGILRLSGRAAIVLGPVPMGTALEKS